MTQWINFKLLKDELKFETVLSHYGVKTVTDGAHHVKGSCPFHDDKRPSLGIDLAKKIWQCFACKTSGNILDFVTRMEGLDPAEPGAIRKGAEAAMSIMGSAETAHEATKPSGIRRAERRVVSRHAATVAEVAEDCDGCGNSDLSDRIVEDGPDNPVLTFELKLDPCPAIIKSLGIDRETAARFGIGLAKRGLMKDRICVPLHNSEGQIIGYAGYWAEGAPPEGIPLWLYPPKFNLDRFVFNAHRVNGDGTGLMIAACLWDAVRASARGHQAIAWLAEIVAAYQLTTLADGGVTHVGLLSPGNGRAVNTDWLTTLARQAYVRIVEL